MEDKLKELKVPYLFDENGMIRGGLSMKDYARITNAKDEDELNEVILDILEEHNTEPKESLNGETE